MICGVDDGARTHDRWNHNPELYQLSYVHHNLPCVAEMLSAGILLPNDYPILGQSQPDDCPSQAMLDHPKADNSRDWPARQGEGNQPVIKMVVCFIMPRTREASRRNYAYALWSEGTASND